MDEPADCPASPPDTYDALVARVHNTQHRINVVFPRVVHARRQYERERSARYAYYLSQGETPSSVERIIRGDKELADMSIAVIEAEGEFSRLESLYAHWRWMAEHLPADR